MHAISHRQCALVAKYIKSKVKVLQFYVGVLTGISRL